MSYHEKASYNWSDDSVRFIVTPSQTAKSTFFYVEEVGYFHTRPGYFTEREKLNSFLMIFTLSGRGFLTYKGKKYTLEKNQAFFINCMEYQYYETDKDNLWEFNWVHLNGATIKGYYQYFELGVSPVVTLKNTDNFVTAFNQLLQIHQNFNVQSELLSSKLLTDLLTEFVSTIQEQPVLNSYIAETMILVMKFLEQHFNEPLSLDHLAEQFNISKYHLAREFKKYSGLSPNEFLITCRITYAKNALKYSHQSVAAISAEAGVANTSHFINLFKAREGITPLAYRKEWQRPKQAEE